MSCLQRGDRGCDQPVDNHLCSILRYPLEGKAFKVSGIQHLKRVLSL